MTNYSLYLQRKRIDIFDMIIALVPDEDDYEFEKIDNFYKYYMVAPVCTVISTQNEGNLDLFKKIGDHIVFQRTSEDSD